TCVALGVLSLSLVTVSHLAANCVAEHSGCIAASVSFGLPHDLTGPLLMNTETSISTPAYDVTNPSTFSLLFQVIQVTSVYLIMLGVILLVALELRELHYLKRIVRQHRGA
ncbi:MAG: hypothetical protein ACOC4E_03100, partial [Patescibacteria group bacterium]